MTKRVFFNKIKVSNKEKEVNKLQKINSSLAIGQHLINNLKCFVNYDEVSSKKLSRAHNDVYLKKLHLKPIPLFFLLC